MSEKDRPQGENLLTPEQKISRRSMLFGAGGIIFGAFGWQQASSYMESIRNRDPYVDIHNYRFGYPYLSESRKERLLSSIEKNGVVGSFEYLSEEVKGKIHPDEGLPHILVVESEPDPSISVNILELEINDKNIIVPIVQSAEHSQACVYLGDLKEEADISIKNMNIPFPNVSNVSSLKVKAFSVSADPFTMSVIRNIPELYVRQDNKDDELIANDIPLSFDVQLRENWSNVRLVEYTVVFSGEDGGSAPYPLIDTEGRLTDNEVFAFSKLTEFGMTIEEAYQGRSHNVYITNQYYDQPKTTSVGERRQYMVDTDNNMVRPGNETGRFFSPFPDFFQSKLDILDGGIVRDRNRAMKTISIRESYGQGYLKEDDKYLHWYIQNELEGNDLIIPFVKFADISK